MFHYPKSCCPNHFSLALKHFLINLRLVPGDSKTRPSGSNSWNRISFTSLRFINKKRFNERSKRFSFGQQPVKLCPHILMQHHNMSVLSLDVSNERSSPCVFKKGDMFIGSTMFQSDPIFRMFYTFVYTFKILRTS
jgi:hypothetical protein